eukprot:2586982-Rhodomonas_salina.2
MAVCGWHGVRRQPIDGQPMTGLTWCGWLVGADVACGGSGHALRSWLDDVPARSDLVWCGLCGSSGVARVSIDGKFAV